MRHIQINQILAQIFADDDGKESKKRLDRAHKKLAKMQPADRKAHTDRNGGNKWSPINAKLTQLLGDKCWYTEVEITGSSLAIDHYRPICDYWWLSFQPENYRISCSWANSPKHNPLYGCAGGKGDNFPLLPPGLRATGNNRLRVESPVILDPCKSEDCELLAFQVDGRPILNPAFAGNAVSTQRVEQSKLLLNLDHPDFNSKREQLCRDIADDVRAHEALSASSPERVTFRTRLERRLAPNAPYSTAARFYLRLHRYLDWVEQILNQP